jgi:hypothetical protein
MHNSPLDNLYIDWEPRQWMSVVFADEEAVSTLTDTYDSVKFKTVDGKTITIACTTDDVLLVDNDGFSLAVYRPQEGSTIKEMFQALLEEAKETPEDELEGSSFKEWIHK